MPAAASHRRRLAIVGLGHVGGSVALAAKARGQGEPGQTWGFDRDSDVRRRALELGIVDRAPVSAVEAVAEAEVVVLACPVRAIPAAAREIAPALGAGTLIVDVGSVKGALVRQVRAVLPPEAKFVGCHPLAGTERAGPESARADLFEGRRCLVCPDRDTPRAVVEEATALWRALGASTSELDPDRHDALLAATSHLPHVAAYALAAALADAFDTGGVGAGQEAAAAELASVVTTSLRDTTRIAASSPIMWRDILIENRAHVGPLLVRLADAVAELRAAMDAGDADAIEAFLTRARDGRRRLVEDVGGPP